MITPKTSLRFFIIALLGVFTFAGAVFAVQHQKLFVRVADVLVCAIRQAPATSFENVPITHCSTNDGNAFTIIRKISRRAITDTVIPIP